MTILFWSIATLSLGLANGLTLLIILRMIVGLFEVPSFLMNNRIATTWFGEKERATCIAVYTAAEFVGLAFLTPVLAWVRRRSAGRRFSWRPVCWGCCGRRYSGLCTMTRRRCPG